MKKKIKYILYLCVIVILFSFYLMPSKASANANNAQVIEKISLGKNKEGNLKGGEIKVFTIKPPKQGRLEIKITCNIMDEVGSSLYSEDNQDNMITQIKGFDQEKGCSTTEYVVYVSSTTYYLNLYNILQVNEGSFVIETKFNELKSIKKDVFNNTQDRAISLSNDKLYYGIMAFDEVNDYYKIKFAKSTKFKLQVACLDEAVVDIAIIDSKGNTLNSGWSYYNTNVYSYEDKLSKGTYTIRISKGGKQYLMGRAYTLTLGSYVGISSISIPSSKNMKVGDKSTIVPTIKPANATEKYTYSTSNSKVIKVSESGKLTAIAEGTATITVKTADKNISDKCKVTVKGIPVTKVSINKKKATLYVNETVVLKATLSPKNATNKHISWETSNKSVATVNSSGKVTAKKSGTCKITASVGKISTTCTVEVKNKPAPTPKPTTIVKPTEAPVTELTQAPAEIEATSIIMTHTLKLTVGDTKKLDVTIVPEDSTDKFLTWKSTNPDVVSVIDGKINCLKAGKATIIVSLNKITAYCTVIVNE